MLRRFTAIRSLLALFILAAAVLPAGAQAVTSAPTAGVDPCLRSENHPELFGRFIKRKFATLVSPDAVSGVGDYISTDIKDKKLTFATTFVTEKGVFALKGNGGVSDGIATLWKGSSLKSNVGLEAQWNFLTHNSKGVDFAVPQLQVYCEATRKLAVDSVVEMERIRGPFPNAARLRDSLNRLSTIEKTRKDSVALHLELERARSSGNDTLALSIRLRLDSLHLVHTRLRLPNTATAVSAAQMEAEAGNARDAAREKLMDSVKLERSSLAWFSIGGRLTQNNFKLFNDTTNSHPDTLSKDDSYTTPELYLRWNSYETSRFGAHLISAFIIWKETDNISDLTEAAIQVKTVRKALNDSLHTTLESARTDTAYYGNYERAIKAGTYGVDMYFLSSMEHRWGFHVSPFVELQQKKRPVTTVELGLLHGFAGKEQAIVTVELFAKFNDVGHTKSKSDPVVIKNTTGGLRISVPLAFVF
jgi:hypothetical protein